MKPPLAALRSASLPPTVPLAPTLVWPHAANRPLTPSALISGALWTVGTRWAVKAMGFVNTIVVARFIAPQNCGLVALAFLMVALTQALLDFGASTALLRQPTTCRVTRFDSAWTLTVIRAF